MVSAGEIISSISDALFSLEQLDSPDIDISVHDVNVLRNEKKIIFNICTSLNSHKHTAEACIIVGDAAFILLVKTNIEVDSFSKHMYGVDGLANELSKRLKTGEYILHENKDIFYRIKVTISNNNLNDMLKIVYVIIHTSSDILRR